MPGANPSKSVLLWLDPEQVPLVRAVVEAAGLDVAAAGSPRTGRSSEVAGKLGDSVAVIDDLRATLTTFDGAAAIIAAPDQFGAHADDQAGEIDALRACRERGVRIATLEPIPASALQLASGWLDDRSPPEAGGSDLAHMVPLARASSAWLSATEVMADFGPVRSVVFEAWCRPHEGSLGARLMDATDFILSVLGEPETIDAAYIAPPGPGGASGALRRLPGDTLRGLQGTLTANLRFADGRAACLALSDHGARWGRTITLLGPGGRLKVFDDGFEWLDASGARADSTRSLGAGRGGPDRAQSDSRSAAVIAEAITRMLDTTGSAPATPIDNRRALAMAGAALLSARTGEGESPDTIRKMALITA